MPNPMKILGAKTLTNESSAANTELYSLDKIHHSIMSEDDMVFVQNNNGLYTYRANVNIPGPEENLPFTVVPNSLGGYERGYQRWYLMDLYGKEVYTKAVKAIDNNGLLFSISTSASVPLSGIFINNNGNTLIYNDLTVNGNLQANTFTISSSARVDNLNAEYINGYDISGFVLTDGTNAYTAPVSGVTPTLGSHLATKAYVDSGDYHMMKYDGTTSFTAPIIGVTPVSGSHLVTKDYVDDNASNEMAWTIVNNTITLSAALVKNEKRIFMKNGTYDFGVNDLILYDGLTLKGEGVPSDVNNSLSDGVLIKANSIRFSGTPSIYSSNVLSAAPNYLDSQLKMIPRIDAVPVGSLVVIDDKYTYTLQSSAATSATTWDLSEKIYQDISDFTLPVSGIGLRVFRNNVGSNNYILENVKLEDFGIDGSLDVSGFINFDVNKVAVFTDSINFRYGDTLSINKLQTPSNSNAINYVSVNNLTYNNIKVPANGNRSGYFDYCQDMIINNVQGGAGYMNECHNFVVSNAHYDEDYEPVFHNCKRFYVQNNTSNYSTYGFDVDGSKYFTITGCYAPNTSTPVYNITAPTSAYSIHGNHWQSDDFQPVVTTPNNHDLLTWDNVKKWWKNTSNLTVEGSATVKNELHIGSTLTFNTTAYVGDYPTHEEGTMFYDGESHTFLFYNDVSDVMLNVGEQWTRVRNNTPEIIPNGAVVYVSGTQGNTPEVQLAVSSNFNRSKIIGVATHDIPNSGAPGIVTTFGIVHDVDTSMWGDGEMLWVSDTISGGMTNVEPPPPSLSIPIAIVLNSNAQQGALLVRTHFPVKMANGNEGSIQFKTGYTQDYDDKFRWDKTSSSLVLNGSLSGSINFTDPVSGVAPVISSHLATKSYVDSGDYHMMKYDGTTSFTAPIIGITPTLSSHLTTKAYVDSGDYHMMKYDGTTSFTAPIIGITPTLSSHLATKSYVDNSDYHMMKYDGTTSFTAPIIGVAPVSGSHLVTKDYVDSNIGTGTGTVTFTEYTSAYATDVWSDVAVISLSANTVRHFEFFIVSNDGTADNANAFKINCLAKNLAGTSTLINSATTVVGEEDVTFDVQVVVDATNELKVQVKGHPVNTVNWQVIKVVDQVLHT